MSFWLRIRLIFFWAVSGKAPVHPSIDLTLYWIYWLFPQCSCLIEGLCLSIWTAHWYQRGLGHTLSCRRMYFMVVRLGVSAHYISPDSLPAAAILTDWEGISLLPCWTSSEKSKNPGHLFHTEKHDLVSNKHLTLICELSDAFLWWVLLVLMLLAPWAETHFRLTVLWCEVIKISCMILWNKKERKKKLLREEIEEDFVINKETDTVFLLQSLVTRNISEQLEVNACYLNRVVLSLCSCFRKNKPWDYTWNW